MAQRHVGGLARIMGQEFAFPTNGGIGLIELEGALTLVEFSCLLDSVPPRGTGHVLTNTGITLQLEQGRPFYEGRPVVLGEVFEK